MTDEIKDLKMTIEALEDTNKETGLELLVARDTAEIYRIALLRIAHAEHAAGCESRAPLHECGCQPFYMHPREIALDALKKPGKRREKRLKRIQYIRDAAGSWVPEDGEEKAQMAVSNSSATDLIALEEYRRKQKDGQP